MFAAVILLPAATIVRLSELSTTRMQTYLGLGANLGHRADNLSRALEMLGSKELMIRRISPVVESPALLPDDAPAEWNLPFLNLVAECETEVEPESLFDWIREIQTTLGRTEAARWSPRPIDIDILLWGRKQIDTERLTIPHPRMQERSFVLTPLIALEPRMTIPGLGSKTLLDWSRELQQHLPLWMGILNITPDSFSDGGTHQTWSRIEPHLDAMIDAGVHIIDVGGESTRPGAEPISSATEWQRIEPILRELVARRDATPLAPRISVDTYHANTARRALALGVDVINDVSGLTTPKMIELAKTSSADWVAMHSVSVPADPLQQLPADCDSYREVEYWLLEHLEIWDRAGLNLNRIIFDPGIGFGKSGVQSLQLLSRAGDFRQHGCRVLVGHSRKSFLKVLPGGGNTDKDLSTLDASLRLCEQGVDILRIHNVPLHTSAYRDRHGPLLPAAAHTD